MWRVIIRIGYFNDVQSRLRNRIVQLFNTLGLHNTATGTFESTAAPRAQAAIQLSNVLQAIADPQQFPVVSKFAVGQAFQPDFSPRFVRLESLTYGKFGHYPVPRGRSRL